jgi:hypothetical protein
MKVLHQFDAPTGPSSRRPPKLLAKLHSQTSGDQPDLQGIAHREQLVEFDRQLHLGSSELAREKKITRVGEYLVTEDFSVDKIDQYLTSLWRLFISQDAIASLTFSHTNFMRDLSRAEGFLASRPRTLLFILFQRWGVQRWALRRRDLLVEISHHAQDIPLIELHSAL